MKTDETEVRGVKKSRAETWQVAALPFRVSEAGDLQVLLVTSRETQRWLIPKGWPMKGKKPHEAAAREALEEAGVEGEISSKPLGRYSYWKRKSKHFQLCQVDVYRLAVQRQLASWREQGQREARWFGVSEAADRVLEPALADLIRRLPQEI
jgi:8-oxo-dGTP pyrophosphatase MutT (NUDIX family)